MNTGAMEEPLYFEALSVGDCYIAPERIISGDDLNLFAEVSGDDHPIHVDDEYAKSTPFGQRIAHGPLGIAIAIGQFGRIPGFQETAIAMTDVREWNFMAPIFVGDVISVEVTIINKTLKRAGLGLIDRQFRLIKADGVIAQQGHSGMLIACRPGPSAT